MKKNFEANVKIEATVLRIRFAKNGAYYGYDEDCVLNGIIDDTKLCMQKGFEHYNKDIIKCKYVKYWKSRKEHIRINKEITNIPYIIKD